MATVFSTDEFEQLFLGEPGFFGDLEKFSLANQSFIDDLGDSGSFSPVSLASDRIELEAINPFTGQSFDLIVTGSGISPVSTLDALEQAVMDGLASGSLDKISISTNGFEFLRLDISPTGYTLTSDAQVLEVVGNLPDSLEQIGGFVTAVADFDAALDAQTQQGALDDFLTELNKYDFEQLVLRDAGVDLFRIDASENLLAIYVQDHVITISGNFSDVIDGTVDPDLDQSAGLVINSFVVTNPAGEEIASIRDIGDLDDFVMAFEQLVFSVSNDMQGTDGDDFLIGTPEDDLIITGDATPNGDFVVGSTGDDTIVMSGMNQSTAFMTMSYQDLGSAIIVNIDGAANTATVDKGALGTDTLVDIENPLNAGFNLGGFGVIGTSQADTFNLDPVASQWMQARGGNGADSYDIGDTGFVRLGFAFTEATQGAEIDLGLSSGQVINDGFGNTETISGPGTVWEIRGTENDDLITGSAADESFISQQGNDTIDGGGGSDRLRYDRFGVDGINGDLAAGQVSGIWNGNAFTDTVSNIEDLRGSNNNDVIGGDTNDNLLEGRDGTDTFVHLGGDDTIGDFDPLNETLIVRIAGLDQATVTDALNTAQDTADGALATFGAGSVLFSNLGAGDLAAADVRFVEPGVVLPPPPPLTAAAWTLGDPHLLTLDGLGYDFHAVGEYVLLRGQAGDDVGGFEIQSRMTPATDNEGADLDNVSVNAAIAMRAANGDAVMIDSTDGSPLSINGVVAELADGDVLDVGDDRIFRSGDTYTMVFAGADGVLNDGDTQVAVVVHDARVDLSVRISEALAGRVEGLLGDGDGSTGNDIARADGTVLERPLAFEDLYGGYRDDWRVDAEGDSLFTYDTGESLGEFYDPTKPGAVATLDDFDAGDLAAAQQAVTASGLTPGTLNYDNALLDFLLTDDQSFIDSAASEDVAAPDTASAAPTLDVGQGRATVNISVTDRGGDGIEGASVGFSAGSATARSLANDQGGGAYSLSVGDGATGLVGGTLEFSNSGEITAGDALEVLRIAVGLDPSWGPAQGLDFVSADLNGDAQVTAGDALEVLRSAVGLDSEHAPEWVFTDPDQDVSGASANDVPELGGVDIAAVNGIQNVEMTAVLLGNMDSFA